MCWSSDHLIWLVKTTDNLSTVDGKNVDIFELKCNHDNKIMSSWAAHFRNHYCSDREIDLLRSGTGLSKKDYLVSIKFPDKTTPPGPSTRSGDFGEILVADYLQYILGFWVPRIRYARKAVRNESVKGSDILGFKYSDSQKESPKDCLAVFEAKAQLTRAWAHSRLQDAIDDSSKDEFRKAFTLNDLKQHFVDIKDEEQALKVERFQDKPDRPFQEISGASAVISNQVFDLAQLASTVAKKHPNHENLYLLIIRGDDLMCLAHELYEKAANEA